MIEEVVIGLEVVVRVEVREEDRVRIAVEAASVYAGGSSVRCMVPFSGGYAILIGSNRNHGHFALLLEKGFEG